MVKVALDGRKLRQARKSRHLTQETLAERAEISDRYLRSMESGKKDNPSLSVTIKLCSVLNIAVEELVITRAF